METGNLIDSFADFARFKNIDRPTMIRILEDVFRTLVRKKFGSDDNFDVIINPDKGDLEIWRFRDIVADNAPDFDETSQIYLSDARKIESDFEEGEEVAEEVKILDFGRRLVQTARQTLIQKVRDLEKSILFDKYKDLVGEVVMCEVHQVLGRETILLDNEGDELSLPRGEQISKDRFRKGDSVRSVVEKVDMVNGNPKIIMSRTSPVFLEKLFESEVPEVFDGLITVKGVAREPGERAKVAVESYDDRIDPVGACVGMKGSRIHGIVRELQNENIDVINYTENKELFIQRALSPAKTNRIKLDESGDTAYVYLDRDQVSLAIGKGGLNIRLAISLVGTQIEVLRDGETEADFEDDIELTEFDDVVDQWIIDEFHKVGLDTAKSVLSLSVDDLIRRTDLEAETVEFLVDVLKKEFE